MDKVNIDEDVGSETQNYIVEDDEMIDIKEEPIEDDSFNSALEEEDEQLNNVPRMMPLHKPSEHSKVEHGIEFSPEQIAMNEENHPKARKEKNDFENTSDVTHNQKTKSLHQLSSLEYGEKQIDSNSENLTVQNIKEKILNKTINYANLKGQCPLCPYGTTKRSSLRRHLESHTDIRTHLCPHCIYRARCKQTLDKHIKIHTGEKNYSCAHCNYKCIAKGDLQKHIKIHTGEKNYQCTFCSYKATQKSTLKAHTKIHTGEKDYQCPQCNYKTSFKSSLTAHIRCHTGEKNHSCTHCPFKAARKCQLNNHFKTHTGERDYWCTYCPYKAALKDSLNRHIKARHKSHLAQSI